MSTKKTGRLSKSISDVLFSKIRRQLLTLFYISNNEYYFREITRLVNASPGTVQRELKTLTETGLLISETKGRQKYYRANRSCMIYEELKSIVVKTFGVIDTLSKALLKEEDKIDFACVYGSIASGTDTADSDIDLLVIGSISFRTMVKNLKSAEDILNRQLNPTLYTTKEFKEKASSKNNFIKELMQSKKIMIKGTEDELRGMAGK